MRNGGGADDADDADDAATADEAGAGAGDWDGKFAVPVATHLVSRPRLHARLTAGLRSCCTLIAAPAGWGKTLLVGSWLAEGGADRAAAWISLGPADDDVRALWTAVATAIAPVLGERAAADLRRVITDDNLETVPGRVAAVLADDATPVVLVLDNLHELTSLAVHESLLRLVGRPPEGCGWWPPHAGIRRGRWTGSAWPGCSPRSGPPNSPSGRTRRRRCWPSSGSTSTTRTSGGWSSGPRAGRPVCGWPPCSCRAAQIPPGSSMRSPVTTTRWPPTC
jgi:hypothetical protein